MLRWFDALFDAEDLMELRLVDQAEPDPKRKVKQRVFCKAGEVGKQAAKLAQDNSGGLAVFVGANPRRRHGGKTADVLLARSVFVDMDGMAAEAALATITAAGLPTPTVTVSSGHGLHAYWRLDAPMQDLGEWTRAQQALAERVGGDHVHDAPRCMRLPGFRNWKEPAADCRIMEADPKRRYRLQDVVGGGGGEVLPGVGVEVTERTERTEVIETTETTETTERTENPKQLPPTFSPFSLLQQGEQQRELAKALDHAVTISQPTGPRQRHRQVFTLARALKAISAAADWPVARCKPVVAEWHRRAKAVIRTQGFDETWADFVNSWENVRYALGESPMDTIMEKLESNPPPPEAAGYDTPAVRRLVAVCAELQRQAKAGPFHLDCRTAGRLLGVEPVTAWRYLKMLVADGLLAETTKGKPGHATRWRWCGK